MHTVIKFRGNVLTSNHFEHNLDIKPKMETLNMNSKGQYTACSWPKGLKEKVVVTKTKDGHQLKWTNRMVEQQPPIDVLGWLRNLQHFMAEANKQGMVVPARKVKQEQPRGRATHPSTGSTIPSVSSNPASPDYTSTGATDLSPSHGGTGSSQGSPLSERPTNLSSGQDVRSSKQYSPVVKSTNQPYIHLEAKPSHQPTEPMNVLFTHQLPSKPSPDSPVASSSTQKPSSPSHTPIVSHSTQHVPATSRLTSVPRPSSPQNTFQSRSSPVQLLPGMGVIDLTSDENSPAPIQEVKKEPADTEDCVQRSNIVSRKRIAPLIGLTMDLPVEKQRRTNHSVTSCETPTMPRAAVRKASTPRKVTTPQASQNISQPSGLQHPAPLPGVPEVSVPLNQLLPPKPDLQISRYHEGVLASWRLPSQESVQGIARFQLYAYQETSEPPTPNNWQKVAEFNASHVAMSCTIKHMQLGHWYHFAIRAVDNNGRKGSFSAPSSVNLN